MAPPTVYLDQVARTLRDRIEVSAQNAWVGKGGAFTGEVRYVLVFLVPPLQKRCVASVGEHNCPKLFRVLKRWSASAAFPASRAIHLQQCSVQGKQTLSHIEWTAD